MRPDAPTMERWTGLPKCSQAQIDMEIQPSPSWLGRFGSSLDSPRDVQYTPSERKTGICNCSASAGTAVRELALQSRLSSRWLFIHSRRAAGRTAPAMTRTSTRCQLLWQPRLATPSSNPGAACLGVQGDLFGSCRTFHRCPTNYPFSSTLTVQTITTTSVHPDDAILDAEAILNQGKCVCLSPQHSGSKYLLYIMEQLQQKKQSGILIPTAGRI